MKGIGLVHKRVKHVFVIGLSGLLLTACADGRISTVSPPGGSSVATAVSSTNGQMLAFPDTIATPIVLAVDAYRPTAAQAAYLLWSAETVTNSCVRSLGIDSAAPAIPTAVAIGTGNDRRYGVIDRAQAAVYGYHVANEVTGPSSSSDLASVPANVLDGGTSTSTYNGRAVPAGGCRGQAQRALGADDATTHGQQAGTVANIGAASYGQSQQSPALQRVFAQWSSCMAAKGFKYASPNDAIDAADLANPTPSKAEIATAVADVDCKKTSGVVAAWVSVENAIEKPLIAQDQATLDSYKASFTAALVRSASVTGVKAPK